MASIVETVVGDRRVRLSREEYLRQFSFGNNWIFLRIVLRMSLTPGAAANPNASFFVGVSSGTSAGYLNANTTDAIGVRYGNGAQSWSKNATNYQPSAAPTMRRKVGAVDTTTVFGSTFGPSVWRTDVGTSALSFDLWRDSISSVLSFKIMALNAAATRAQAYAAADGDFSLYSNGAFITNASSVGTYYDSINVWWNSDVDHMLEISDLIAARIA